MQSNQDEQIANNKNTQEVIFRRDLYGLSTRNYVYVNFVFLWKRREKIIYRKYFRMSGIFRFLLFLYERDVYHKLRFLGIYEGRVLTSFHACPLQIGFYLRTAKHFKSQDSFITFFFRKQQRVVSTQVVSMTTSFICMHSFEMSLVWRGIQVVY